MIKSQKKKRVLSDFSKLKKSFKFISYYSIKIIYISRILTELF